MEEIQMTKREKRELAKKDKSEKADKERIARFIRKYITWILVGMVVLFIGTKTYKWSTRPEPEVQGVVTQVDEGDWIKGNKDAPVILVEYSDFQCPACANYYPLVIKLSEEFPNDLKIVYRHFPLFSHRNAVPAAVASEAAGVQGKFWEMHNILFDKQKEWSTESDPKDKFVQYAKDIGLDEEKFKTDMDSESLKQKVENEGKKALSIGLNATPTFFLNGIKIQPRGYEEFKKLVEDQVRGYTLE